MLTGTCHNCNFYHERCLTNPECRYLYNQLMIKCRYIAEWDESNNMTEPVCNDECKSLYLNYSKTHHSDWIMDHCCDNGKFYDDSKLEEVQGVIRQHSSRINMYRFCSESRVVPEKCGECKPKGKK